MVLNTIFECRHAQLVLNIFETSGQPHGFQLLSVAVAANYCKVIHIPYSHVVWFLKQVKALRTLITWFEPDITIRVGKGDFEVAIGPYAFEDGSNKERCLIVQDSVKNIQIGLHPEAVEPLIERLVSFYTRSSKLFFNSYLYFRIRKKFGIGYFSFIKKDNYVIFIERSPIIVRANWTRLLPEVCLGTVGPIASLSAAISLRA